MTSLDKVLRIQKINRLLGAVLVPMAVWLGLNALWPGAGFLWWITFIVCLAPGLHLYEKASLALTVAWVTVTMSEEELKLNQGPTIDVFTVVNHPEESIGVFKDKLIYEWVDLDTNGEIRRAYFTGTADLESGFVPSTGLTVIVFPGLLYEFRQVEEQ